MAPLWGCELCCEEFRDYTSIDIQGSEVCPRCVREMFEKALKFEHEYPPNWSGPLHPSEFSHIFSADYIERYKQKEIEYKTQPSRRIYCRHIIAPTAVGTGGSEVPKEPCGEFIGVRHRLSKPDMLILGRCKKCKNATCMTCDDYSSDATVTLQHVCKGKLSTDDQRAQAFGGLERGKDWQQCPSRQCGRRIELSAACNHITCKCGMGFCFICGKEADGDDEHWSRKNGCPRYNHPDDLDAEYDQYDDEEDDNDDPVAPAGDEEGGDDPLENVRGLFELEEEDDEIAAFGPNLVYEEIPSRSGDGYPNLLAQVRASIENSNRAMTDLAARAEEVVALTRSWTEDRNPRAEELLGMPDAEAIMSAYYEDELSEEEHDAYEALGNTDGFVTMEEADIDRALWRMRVD
jgi:hypothetical protein